MLFNSRLDGNLNVLIILIGYFFELLSIGRNDLFANHLILCIRSTDAIGSIPAHFHIFISNRFINNNRYILFSYQCL